MSKYLLFSWVTALTLVLAISFCNGFVEYINCHPALLSQYDIGKCKCAGTKYPEEWVTFPDNCGEKKATECSCTNYEVDGITIKS